jgi:hypothetical protein
MWLKSIYNPKHTTSRSETSVSSLLRFLVITLAKIINTGVDNYCTLILVSNDLENIVSQLTPITLSGPINLMSLSVVLPLEFPWPSYFKLPKSPTWRVSSSGAPCVFPCGLTVITIRTRRFVYFGGPPTVRTSGCAAVGVVTELMNVASSLSVGIVASDIPWDVGWRRFGFLLEGESSSDLSVTSDFAD